MLISFEAKLETRMLHCQMTIILNSYHVVYMKSKLYGRIGRIEQPQQAHQYQTRPKTAAAAAEPVCLASVLSAIGVPAVGMDSLRKIFIREAKPRREVIRYTARCISLSTAGATLWLRQLLFEFESVSNVNILRVSKHRKCYVQRL